MPGEGFSYSGLMQNPLFLEMLFKGGASIAQGQGLAPGVADVGTRQIGAANTMQMLQRMLGAEGKATIGGDGSLNIKSTLGDVEGAFEKNRKLKSGSNYGSEVAMNAPGTSDANTFGSSGIDSMIGSYLNPSQGYLGNPDLAGLSSSDILNIFGVASEHEKMQKLTHAKEMEQLAKLYKAQTPEGLDSEFPIEVPGIGKVTVRQWNALSNDQKEYAYYVHGAKKSAGTDKVDIPSFQEYKELDKSERIKFFKEMANDPELRKSAIRYQLAGAGKDVEGIVEKAEGELLTFFDGPDYVSNLNKLTGINDKRPPSSTKEAYDQNLKLYDQAISIFGKAGIEVIDEQMNDTSMIFTVKKPNKDTEETVIIPRRVYGRR